MLSKRATMVLAVLGVVAILFVLWSVVNIMQAAGPEPVDQAECILDPNCTLLDGEPVYLDNPTETASPSAPTFSPDPPLRRDVKCPPNQGCINPPPLPTE